jgi:hypothetical protein
MKCIPIYFLYAKSIALWGSRRNKTRLSIVKCDVFFSNRNDQQHQEQEEQQQQPEPLIKPHPSRINERLSPPLTMNGSSFHLA